MAVWYWQRDTHTDEWNRLENPGIELHKYAPMIFDRGARQFNEEKRAFSTDGAGAIGHP
jgi:hypothetical protein